MGKEIISNDDFDFKKAFEESFKDYQENTVIKATVQQISNETVFLNFGYKAEAKLSTTEFTKLPKIGEEIEVFLVRLEGKNGEPIVSKKRVDGIKDKNTLMRLKNEEKVIKGIVTEVNRNGAFVTYNSVRGYIPMSMFDFEPVKLENFLNKEISLGVIVKIAWVSQKIDEVIVILKSFLPQPKWQDASRPT